MSTATTLPTLSAEAVGAVTQQKTISRRYVKLGQVDDGKGNLNTVIVKSSVPSESEKKEPEKIKDAEGKEIPNPHAGQAISFANAERNGLELFTENEFVTYDVKSFEGAELLTPDPALRLYIYRKGLSVFQDAIIQKIMKAEMENTTEPTPEFQGQTIDLRVGTDDEGTNSINRAPARKAMTLDDKLFKVLIAQGWTEAEALAAVARINIVTAPAVKQEVEEEVEVV